MNIQDLNELRSEFEQMQKQAMVDACVDNSCLEESYDDYPDYLKAIYEEIMPPLKSGIYFSRWDLKGMAAEIDESFALDVRERMFQKFMQWISTPDDMKLVMEQFKNNIDIKCDMYREYAQRYPSTQEIFNKKIEKAEKAKQYLDKVYVEFFT
jgi:hypothetical protein